MSLREKQLNAEMDKYLGYEKNTITDFSNLRNGYFRKDGRGLFRKTRIWTSHD